MSIGTDKVDVGDEWLKVISKAGELWHGVRSAKSFRNSFVTCIAPTGTISAPLGIYEEGTTSAEPEYSLVKHKQLSGGGTMTLINGLVPMGLQKLGYSFEQIVAIIAEVSGLAGVENFLQSRKIKDRTEILKNLREGGEICREIIGRIGSFRDDEEYHEFFNRLASLSEKGKLPISDMSIFYGCGHMEGIPWVNEETLRVFDCANTAFGGTRCIATEGHVKMLGALQPFISGASSKTINMPATATETDIVNSLIESHQLGVKCIAIYRDGLKSQRSLQHPLGFHGNSGSLAESFGYSDANPHAGARKPDPQAPAIPPLGPNSEIYSRRGNKWLYDCRNFRKWVLR